MKRRFLLMGLAAASGVLIAALPTLTATATSAVPMTGSFVASDYMFTAAGGGMTVTIAQGGTVDFSYPTGNSVHNVDFGSGPQPTSCTLGGQNQAPPIPSTPTAPGWSGSCTFNTPGTYTFKCDRHPFMTGTIIVESATSTTTTATTTATTTSTSPSGSTTGPGPTTPTPTTTTMPMTGPMSMPMPGSGTSTTTKPKPSPIAGSARRAIKIIGVNGGGQVQGTIKISAAGRGGHALITVLASRAALRHGAPHAQQLITLGSTRLNRLHPGTDTFKVAVESPARRALSSYRRLAITIRVTVIAAGAKTVTLSRSAVLRA